MTTAQRQALKEAKRGPLRRVFDREHGQPTWPAPAATLASLVRRGLLARTERLSRQGHRLWAWEITEAGKQALRPPERYATERPRFLVRPGKNHGDYSTDPRLRIDPLEVVGEASLVWRRRGETRRLAAQDRRAAAGRLAKSLRAA